MGNDDEEEGEEEEEKYPWRNTPYTTKLWNMIHEKDYDGIKEWIEKEPEVVHIRSGDGRGPLWWAYEHKNKKIVKLLKKHGADKNALDSEGNTKRYVQTKTKIIILNVCIACNVTYHVIY